MEACMEDDAISHGTTLDEVRLNDTKESKAIKQDDGDRNDGS
jgi:hypothetical protein